MRRPEIFKLPLLLLALAPAMGPWFCRAQSADPYAHETPAARDARMAWWRDAKFGMFIHWGVYAVPAGTYDGRAVDGIGEWIMLNARIPVATYRSYAGQFNPVKYQPSAWAALAKEAGMRYVVLTAKHHDGFALFPSSASKWNVADATPWKKDLVGPLAAAVREQGLKFGLYYSQAQDWTHPGGAKAGHPDGGGWDDAHKGSFDRYIDAVAVPQVREILTNYQPDVLWWDTPHLMDAGRADKLVKLLALRPGIIHNNRLGGGHAGDTETPEQEIPSSGIAGRDWETCMTLNDTWGFKSHDHHWKSLATVIHNLVDIVSKGGNYLLNVGPNADGEIPRESVDLLKGVGAWMKVNAEAIHGTRANPFKRLDWGRCTIKPAGEETHIYLHVFQWPAGGKLLVPGLTNEVKGAVLLAGAVPLACERTADGPLLTVPAAAPDAISSTIKLVVQGQPAVADVAVTAGADGVIRLLPGDAKCHGNLRPQGTGSECNIGYWTNPKDSVAWTLRADHDGKFTIHIDASAPAEGSVLLIQDIGKLAYTVPKTGNYATFQATKVGEVKLAKGANITLTLRPVADGWHPVNIRKVELVPLP